MGNKRMTSVEKEQWNKLYSYVKKEILSYDDAQSIPSSFVLRLKGLTKGKYLENKKIEDRADYSYEIILYTFQICKPSIMNAIATKTFKDESNKFNYICKIVENNINDVYMRFENAKKTQTKTEQTNVDVLSHDTGKYHRKTSDLKNNKLEELW